MIGSLRSNVERVANELVRMVAYLLDRYGKGKLPPREEIPKLADVIWRIRPLGMMAVESEVSRALEQAANKFLGDRVAQILEAMQTQVE